MWIDFWIRNSIPSSVPSVKQLSTLLRHGQITSRRRWSDWILETERGSSEHVWVLSTLVWRNVEEPDGRRRRQQETVSILYWPVRTGNSLPPSFSRSFRTQSHWYHTAGQCANPEQFLRVHLSCRMCSQFTIHNKEVDLGEPTSFLDHVYLGSTQRQCEISKEIVDNYRTMFESRISVVRLEKLTFPQNLRISSWSYDMAGHAKKCVERHCELANKTTQQLYKVSTPCIDDHHFEEEEEETKSVGELSNTCSLIFLKCLYLARIGRPDILWSVKTSHDPSQNGPKLVTNAWIDWFHIFIIRVIQTVLSCGKYR